MNIFDVAAVLVAVAAAAGYINHRVLRLPPTSGTLLVALVSSLAVLLIGSRAAGMRPLIERSWARSADPRCCRACCPSCCSPARCVDLDGLVDHRWTIGLLATVGLLLSVAVVGAAWLVFAAVGVPRA